MEKLKEIWEYCYDKFFKLTRKFDGVSEKIFEKTGAKIDVGLIVGFAVLGIVLLIFVKAVLGVVMKFLFTGEL